MANKKIYGNCRVYSPNGELMFRCQDRRAKWYLDRNLAHVIDENPLSVQLDFTPKGNGVSFEALKEERKNICVVCGTEENLSRHHIIPSTYRRNFPSHKKVHASIFVVAICLACHKRYNEEFSHGLMLELAETYEAPLDGKGIKWQLLSTIQNLIVFRNEIPDDRKKILEDRVFARLPEFGITDVSRESLQDFNFLRDVRSKIKDCASGIRLHGQIVVSKVKNLNEFERMWAMHFIENMKPFYLSKLIYEELVGWGLLKKEPTCS